MLRLFTFIILLCLFEGFGIINAFSNRVLDDIWTSKSPEIFKSFRCFNKVLYRCTTCTHYIFYYYNMHNMYYFEVHVVEPSSTRYFFDFGSDILLWCSRHVYISTFAGREMTRNCFSCFLCTIREFIRTNTIILYYIFYENI